MSQDPAAEMQPSPGARRSGGARLADALDPRHQARQRSLDVAHRFQLVARDLPPPHCPLKPLSGVSVRFAVRCLHMNIPKLKHRLQLVAQDLPAELYHLEIWRGLA